MIKKFIPTFHANNIYEISLSFFQKNKIKILLLDLDNTLDSYKQKEPSERAYALINELKSHNIRPIIISNNTGGRVERYAKLLSIEFIARVGKPFKKRLLNALKEKNINIDDCLVVGDQLVTDILAGNRAKIKTLLTEKLVKEDQFTTHFNRLFDKPIRARLKKCGKLNNWKNNL